MDDNFSSLNIDNVTWAFDLDLGLKNVLFYLGQNVDINRAVIYIYNEKSDILYSELVYVNGSILLGDDEISLAPRSRDRRVRVLLDRKSIIGDYYLSLPLVLENRIYGLLTVDRSLAKTRFTRKELHFIKQVAHLIKTGIYQNTILASRDNRIRQLNILLEVSMILNRRSRRMILKFIGLILVKYGKFDRVRLYVREKSGVFILAVSESIIAKSREPDGKKYDIGFFSSRDASDIYHIIRMESEEGALGFIEVDNIISQTKIDESQINFLRIIGNQLAIALNNILLLEKLKKTSITDPLTEVYNYRYLVEYLKSEASRARRFGLSFSLLIIDIDNFKTINDRYGHLAGDSVLRAFVKNIKKQIRDIDVLSRYGGDEFILVAPGTDRKNALLLGQKLLASPPVVLSGKKRIGVRCSIGLATFNDDTRDITRLIRMADRRLYLAKKRGRHQVCGGS